MKKILLTLAVALGFSAAKAAGVSPGMLTPVWEASSVGLSTRSIPTTSLLDYFSGTTPEEGTVYSLFDDKVLKIRFTAEVSINPRPTAYPQWIKDEKAIKTFDDPYGNGLNVSTSSTTLSVVQLYQEDFDITEPGTYSLVIPNGYFLVNGELAEGMTLTWTLESRPQVDTNSYTLKFADATDISGDEVLSGTTVTGYSSPTFNLGGLKFESKYSGTNTAPATYVPSIRPEQTSGNVTGFLYLCFQSATSYSCDITVTAPEGVKLTSAAFKFCTALAATNVEKVTGTSANGSVKTSTDDLLWTSSDPQGVDSFTMTLKSTVNRIRLDLGSVDVECVGQLATTPEGPGDEPEGPALETIITGCVPAAGSVRSLYEDDTLKILFSEKVTLNYSKGVWPYWVNEEKTVYTYSSPWDIYPNNDYTETTVMMLDKDGFVPAYSGYFTLVIPDGFILCDGKETKGASLTWLVEQGEVNPDEPVSFESIIDTELTFPQPGLDIDAEDGLSSVNITINSAPAGFAVNPACTDKITLTRDGVAVTSIGVGSDNPGSYPYYDLDGEGDSESWSGKLILAFSMMGINTPGVYTVTIPNAFFKAGNVEITSYSFTYNILPPKEYVDAKYTISPEAGSSVEKLDSFVITFTDETSVNMVEKYKAHIAIQFAPKTAMGQTTTLENWTAAVADNAITFTLNDEELLGQAGTLTAAMNNVFMFGEKYANPIAFSYTITAVGGDTPGTETPSLEKLFQRSDPEQGTIDAFFTEDDYLRVWFNANTLDLSMSGPFPTWKKNGETVATLDYNFGNNWERINLTGGSQLRIFKAGYDPQGPGVYELVIPDNFISVDGVAATGMTLKWTIEGAPETPSLEKLFQRSDPEQGTIDAFFTEDDYLRVWFNANTLDLSMSGPYPTWKKNGETVATLDYNFGNNWERINLTGGSQLRIFKAGYDPQGPGVYELVIPDNFISVDGVAATGMTLKWTIEDNTPPTPVPSTSLGDRVYTIDRFNKVTLTLPEGEVAEIVPGYTAALYAVTTAEVNTLDTRALDDSDSLTEVCTYTLTADGNKVIATSNTTLRKLAKGNYLLSISSGAIKTANYELGALNYEVAFDVNTGIEGIAEASSYSVYTVDGKCLLLNGTIDEVRNLSAGLYLINGAKVFHCK